MKYYNANTSENTLKGTGLKAGSSSLKITGKSKSSGRTKLLIVLVSLFVLAGAGLMLKNNIKSALDPVSIVTNVSAADLKETDGRTNILVLGSDQRKAGAETDRGVLTDTILVASIGRLDGDVVMISLPRDLWVESTYLGRSKINAVYYSAQASSCQCGGKEVMRVVENVLGIPLHYYAVVNFDLFKDSIDVLNGIEVVVDNTFDDFYYPVEGKENAPIEERYESIHFEAGPQTMDGELALKYVRSRHGTNNEDTDFARSKRQQKVIMAIKDKALSLETLINPAKLKGLYDSYSTNVDTNMDLGTVQNFYLLSQQVDFAKIQSVVLDDRSEANDGGLLYAPEDTSLLGGEYGGQYVLLPKTGDYSQIHAFVQKYIFGNK